MTPDIVSTVSELKSRDIKFLDIPSTYYEDIPKRDFTVTEDLKVLEQNQILVDGDPEGYLLQIFSDTYVGPLFLKSSNEKITWALEKETSKLYLTQLRETKCKEEFCSYGKNH